MIDTGRKHLGRAILAGDRLVLLSLGGCGALRTAGKPGEASVRSHQAAATRRLRATPQTCAPLRVLGGRPSDPGRRVSAGSRIREGSVAVDGHAGVGRVRPGRHLRTDAGRAGCRRALSGLSALRATPRGAQGPAVPDRPGQCGRGSAHLHGSRTRTVRGPASHADRARGQRTRATRGASPGGLRAHDRGQRVTRCR